MFNYIPLASGPVLNMVSWDEPSGISLFENVRSASLDVNVIARNDIIHSVTNSDPM